MKGIQAMEKFILPNALSTVKSIGHTITIQQVFDFAFDRFSVTRVIYKDGKWIISKAGKLVGDHDISGLLYPACSDIVNSIIKPALVLPLQFWGTVDRWRDDQPNPFIAEAARHYRRSSIAKMAYMTNYLDALLAQSTIDVPKKLLLNGMLAAYYGETQGDISLHQGFGSGNSVYFGGSKGPASSAFGLGQWLNNRLAGYVYYAQAFCYKVFGYADIPVAALYSPTLQFNYLLWELENAGGYKRSLENAFKTGLNGNIAKMGLSPTSVEAATLIFLVVYQRLPIGSNQNQFKKKTADWLSIRKDVVIASKLQENQVARFDNASVRNSKIMTYA